VIHPQLPLRMPCYDLAPVIDLTLTPRTRIFRYYRLPWLDGRCSEIILWLPYNTSPPTGHAVFPHPSGRLTFKKLISALHHCEAMITMASADFLFLLVVSSH